MRRAFWKFNFSTIQHFKIIILRDFIDSDVKMFFYKLLGLTYIISILYFGVYLSALNITLHLISHVLYVVHNLFYVITVITVIHEIVLWQFADRCDILIFCILKIR